METKNNTALIVITSLLCLLPVILALVLYEDLPEQIAIHWDSSGNPDSFAPKAAAAFGLPVFLMLLNIVSKIRLYNDPKRANASAAMKMIITWLIPVVSVVFIPITLFIAMGANIPVVAVVGIFMGVLLIIAGNYLPKSRQNYTIGIKLPWTLHDPDNWNKTHRMAGYLYIIGGSAFIALVFIFYNSAYLGVITISVIAVLIIFPALYSFLLYKKNGSSQDSE